MRLSVCESPQGGYASQFPKCVCAVTGFVSITAEDLHSFQEMVL